MTPSLEEHSRSDTDRNHCYCFKVATSDKKSFLVKCSLLQLLLNLHKQPCEPEGALRSVLTAQKLFWDIDMSLFELAQSLTFGDSFVRVLLFPLPPRWVNCSETVEGLLVNKTLPVVSSSCLGCALICKRRGWRVSAADWADRQLTDTHNPQTVKLQLRAVFRV